MPAYPASTAFSTGTTFIAQDVCFSRQTDARGKFKLRFGRQTFARPFRVSFRVRKSDLDNRIFFLPFYIALRSLRVPPIRAFPVTPPLIMIVERNFVVGRREHDSAGDQVLDWRSGKLFFRWRAFRDRDVV